MTELIALRHLDPRRQQRITVPAGLTVADMVAQALPDLSEHARPWVRVVIAGEEVPPAMWRHVRLRPDNDNAVVIRVLASGPDLKTILSIAVTVAAVAIGQFYLGPLLAETAIGSIFANGITGLGAAAIPTTQAVGVISGLTTGGLLLAGSVALNAFIPGRTPNNDTGKPLQSISGLRNAFNPNGAVPQNLGFNRAAPPYAAMPYTETIGDDQYIIASFNFGHGPLSIRNVRLGDTSIDSYADIEYEIRNGYASDQPLRLYPEQVIEDPLSIRLTNGDQVRRVSASDITRFSFDLIFPQGLIFLDSEGKEHPGEVEIQFSYRKLGDVAWTATTLSYLATTQSPIRRNGEVVFPERGTYEIEWVRLTPDHDDTASDHIFDRSDLVAMRGFRPEYPLNFDFPVALMSVRIRATDQLNGVLDNLNADVATITLDFNGSSWVTTETNNPAALFRHVLQGDANAYPVLDDGIDLADMADWRQYCFLQGLTFNRFLDGYASQWDTLGDVAAAGRARPHDRGDAWSVVVDKPQDLIVSHISPRNSWDFKGTRGFPKFPDGYRVQFNDEENGFAATERVIPWPGFVGNPVNTADIAMPGKTNAGEIWIEARRRQYEAQLRAETYTVSQDFERLVVSDGSLVKLSHDVLDRTQISGRIKAINDRQIMLDTAVTMEAGQAYVCRFRKSDMSSVLLSVVTAAGVTDTITVTGSPDGLAAGDLAMFGLAASETIEALVKSVEGGENLTAILTLVPHAPELDALAAADDPPPWNGRIGEIIAPSTTPPGIPSIVLVSVSPAAALMVQVAPGAGAELAATFTIAHRLVGGGAFTELTVPVGAGGGTITGYSVGNSVEIKVKATSRFGVSSDYSAIVTTFLHIGYTADSTVPRVDRITITMDSF
jgi:hypothetical protein